MAFYSITELADKFGCSPNCISQLFWKRVVDPERCTIKAGRKLIPENYVSQVERALRGTGKIGY